MAENAVLPQPVSTEEFLNGLAALQPLTPAIMLSRFMTIDLFNEPLRYEASIALSEGRIRDGMVLPMPCLMELFIALFESEISDSETSGPGIEAETTSDTSDDSQAPTHSDEHEGVNSVAW